MDLSEEMIQEICVNLDYESLGRISRTSSKMSRICREILIKKLRAEILEDFDSNPIAFDDIQLRINPRYIELKDKMDSIWYSDLEPFLDESVSDLETYQDRERRAFIKLLNQLSVEDLLILQNEI